MIFKSSASFKIKGINNKHIIIKSMIISMVSTPFLFDLLILWVGITKTNFIWTKNEMPGYSQAEVRVMSVKDAEHQLDIEISENAIRKDWTMSEMLEIARRKERMSAIKGRENQSKGGEGLVNLPKVNSTHDAAEVIGVSDSQYHQMKTIEDNRKLLDPSDFADWDFRRNKMFYPDVTNCYIKPKKLIVDNFLNT